MSAATVTTVHEKTVSRPDGRIVTLYSFKWLTTDGGAVALSVSGNGTPPVTGYIDAVWTELGTSTSCDVSLNAVNTLDDATTTTVTGIGAATGIAASGAPKDALRYVVNAVLKVLVANGGNAKTGRTFVLIVS
ncbi:MAG TPA: hypothetical protein VMZ92_09190 [Planctomycetota bacterium]|nr:hypothetical protein [Planctomycetota bacterium]